MLKWIKKQIFRFIVIKNKKMLLNFDEIVKKYKVQAKGVIAVGAHHGQEYGAYIDNGIRDIVFIEPCWRAFEELVTKFHGLPGVILFNLACGDEIGQSVMYTGDDTVNKGQSNSLLKPDRHLQIHPEVKFGGEELVDVDLLDNLGIVAERYDLLVLDCQGYEGHVLRGAKKILEHINWVYSEVNKTSVYEGCALVEEIDKLLSDFVRVETGSWVGDAWTDAFYVRKTLLK